MLKDTLASLTKEKKVEWMHSQHKDLVTSCNQRREMTVREKIQEMTRGVEPDLSQRMAEASLPLEKRLSLYKSEKSLPEQIREESSKVRVEIRYPDSLYGIR